MCNRIFARVVFAAVLFSAALFVTPAGASALDTSASTPSDQTFTTTPLKQVDSVDVQLEPIWTPTNIIYLTPAPQPVNVSNVNPAEYFPPTDEARTLVIGLGMMACGLAMIYFPVIAKKPRTNNIHLAI